MSSANGSSGEGDDEAITEAQFQAYLARIRNETATPPPRRYTPEGEEDNDNGERTDYQDTHGQVGQLIGPHHEGHAAEAAEAAGAAGEAEALSGERV